MSTYGNKVKLTVFGESHGEGIGAVLEGIPAGLKLDMDYILTQMSRRAPGKDKTATPRLEKDVPELLSGVLDGVLTGAPLCAFIRNTNTKSGDYSNLLTVPRPGHSDFAAYVKYNGHNDIRGGGHFSARLTAPIVFAGAVVREYLSTMGIKIAAHIYSVGSVNDKPFDPVDVDDKLIEELTSSAFSVIDKSAEDRMRTEIYEAQKNLDSVGGIVECAVKGLPAGVGAPLFDGIEGEIAKAIFGIPAVKGIEFGAGFNAARLKGSKNNDGFLDGDKIVTDTNNCGGILGGISDGMPIIFRAAFKPTPSIAAVQNSVDLTTRENTTLSIKGRHDPCVVPRAVPVVEAAAALAIANII